MYIWLLDTLHVHMVGGHTTCTYGCWTHHMYIWLVDTLHVHMVGGHTTCTDVSPCTHSFTHTTLAENKMASVPLSIVFGPSIFRYGNDITQQW